MGYSYSRDANGRMVLDCDGCGDHPARKTRCPFTVTYADGGELPYCPGGAVCATCRPKYATKEAHRAAGCEDGARRAMAREANRSALALTGVYMAISAFGDWHEKVPAGMVGVLATPGGLRVAGAEPKAFLIPATDYKAPEYVIPADAAPWPDPA